MRSPWFCISAIVFCVQNVLAAQTYTKLLDITGAAFYDQFTFDSSADPTHGRVAYVNKEVAQQNNLTYVTNDAFVVRADATTYLLPSDPGRKSVRLVSNQQFTTFVLIFDILHMPVGCGTWPAVWTVGANWPYQGEIDILEGVNNMAPNIASLHTGTNCRMSSSRIMTGQPTGTNCAAYETGNDGCGVMFRDHSSFGPAFNGNQGGWYVVERNSQHIRVFFWSRYDPSAPSEVQFASLHNTISPETWGMPSAVWSNDTCSLPDHFGPHNIVINLTFCGDWAGAVYSSSGCPDTCENFVNSNPGSFNNAYFEFSAINVYA